MKKWFIIALGNPGREYEWTRHNAGFLAAEQLRLGGNAEWKKKLLAKAHYCEIDMAGNPTTVILPQTFMNLSGEAARKFVKSLDDVKQLIVLHDDVHIPIGEFKIKFGGGDAGHNGITSLTQHLKTQDFIRIRIGVGPADGRKVTLSDFVLEKFRPDERELLKTTLVKIPDIVSDVMVLGLEAATKKWHTK